MTSLEIPPLSPIHPATAPLKHQIRRRLVCQPGPKSRTAGSLRRAPNRKSSGTSRSLSVTGAFELNADAYSPKNGGYTVGDFMTKKEDLHVVKSTTSVDEALEMLVENRITGFPVIDGDWMLVGLVSDFDLLALDSVSGTGRKDNDMFPEVDGTWKTFNEVQKLLGKTDGKVVGDVMTPAPVVVSETTNLEHAARMLLETKCRRLPVVDGDGKLVGIITRGNVVRAALQIKRTIES